MLSKEGAILIIIVLLVVKINAVEESYTKWNLPNDNDGCPLSNYGYTWAYILNVKKVISIMGLYKCNNGNRSIYMQQYISFVTNSQLSDSLDELINKKNLTNSFIFDHNEKDILKSVLKIQGNGWMIFFGYGIYSDSIMEISYKDGVISSKLDSVQQRSVIGSNSNKLSGDIIDKIIVAFGDHYIKNTILLDGLPADCNKYVCQKN